MVGYNRAKAVGEPRGVEVEAGFCYQRGWRLAYNPRLHIIKVPLEIFQTSNDGYPKGRKSL